MSALFLDEEQHFSEHNICFSKHALFIVYWILFRLLPRCWV